MFGYRIARYSLIAMIMKLNALEAFKQAPSSKAANSLKDTDLT